MLGYASVASVALGVVVEPYADAAPRRRPASSVRDALNGQAREDYDAGRTLFEHEDFAGAAVKFQSAYDRSKDARLLWNVASCEQRLRHYARTRATLDRYLAEGDRTLTDEDRRDASAVLSAIAPFVSTINLTVEPDGASVAVDEKVVGTTPLPSPLYVDLGKHELMISKDGFRVATRTFSASGGETIPITLRLEAKPHEGHLEVRAGGDEPVSLDGVTIGVGNVSRTVPSGRHDLRVGVGREARTMEIVVEDDRARLVDLRPPPSSSSTTWMFVGGGAVLAAGLVVGGYFLFRPSPNRGVTPTPGTLGFVEVR